VRDADGLREAAAAFMSRHGIPEVVIGNAGISHGNLTEVAEDLQAFRDTLEVNVLGLVNTFHPFVEPMRQRGSGSLVGIASVAGFRGLPGATAYSASKAAAIRYLEGLRVELSSSGVGVTTICPGYIATPMTERNPYRMPFIIDADDAARRFARAIDARRRYVVIPWQMAIVGRILGLIPPAIYDRLAARAGRKPRREG
jgi:short-subunit dehydrogenase